MASDVDICCGVFENEWQLRWWTSSGNDTMKIIEELYGAI